MNLAEKLKYLRIEHGYTLDYVANALGITKSSYNRKENGDTRLQAEEVPKLLQLYNISYDDFYMQPAPPINIRTIPYKKEDLELLETLTKTYGNMSDYGDWDEVKRASDKLHEAMKPVLETRNTALRPPHVSLADNCPTNVTLKSVTLDLHAERIISRAMALEDQLYDEMFRRRLSKRNSDMNKLKYLRISNGKTIQEVANAISIFRETYQNVEQGKEQLPFNKLDELLDYYNITYDDFLDMHVDVKSV